MAATDQTYRNQRALDLVFAVSCILMLVAIVWMFYDDQYRDWKVEQRNFRDVEEVLAERAVIKLAPGEKERTTIVDAEKAVAAAHANVDKTKQQLKPEVDKLLPKQLKAQNNFQNIKAELDSKISFYDIAVDERNSASDPSVYASYDKEVGSLKKEVDTLRAELVKAQNDVDAIALQLKQAQAPQTEAEKQLSDAEDALKKLTADFDRFHRLAEQKRWGAGDWFRSLPVIDAFNSPTRIQQFTLEDLPIDYSFKRVTRYDRCTTCHLGIERASFDRQSLVELRQDPSGELKQKLKDARSIIEERAKAGKSSKGLNPNDIKLTKLNLTDAQINEYCAHPRLDLFVDANSPHNMEKFGCTTCHAGQGSATNFLKAAHTPDNAHQREKWVKKWDWASNHYWDYPMLPSRFIESTCVKCHHQITDTIRQGTKEEAPKLLRGYNLVKDNGCFGCHEIAGMKNGVAIGPDLRLEPSPSLNNYTPAERVKLLADAQNPPGDMRKVGPSLRRLSEKTNVEWLRKWLKAPRDFRPDTKMPHFYLTSNNNPDALKGTGQEDFPDAEINSIAHFLLTESTSYLKGTDAFRVANENRLKELKAINPKEISDKQLREIDELQRKLELNAKPEPLTSLLKDLPAAPEDAKAETEQLKRGRQLFSEKGCLACHQNDATAKADPKLGVPAMPSDAHFGPNLSRLSAKLGNGEKESARRWLVQWILNPMVYHPRTRMPITHLSLDEANDISVWLLAQKTDWKGVEVKTPDTDTLKKLAGVFLTRAFSRREVENLLTNGFEETRVKAMRFDQDERELETPINDDKLKRYIGKKAITQLGCFACHDIPGYEQAKPIGTPLNDWGKKDAERLAFEDAVSFVRKKHYMVNSLTEDNGKPAPILDGKLPYEKFFYESLNHHQREGFLFQKLAEPRSYDFERMRAWDDRLRMPQFRFSRHTPGPNATDEERAAAERDEAEAREAVMTFILGLVAEPVPAKFVYQAPPDRMAEIKGRKVLDSFNCSSCHLVRPGVYDLKVTPELTQQLQASFETASGSFAADHRFPNHNAWAGTTPTRADRLTAIGVKPELIADPDDEKKQLMMLYLTQALRLGAKDADGKESYFDIPAASTARLLPSSVIKHSETWGGTFGDLLTAYLVAKDRTKFAPDMPDNPKESKAARPAVPPNLLHQGEKTQPGWLYQFLKNPHEIRPMVVLRMPKFNLSDEDAMQIVNYFGAASKITNPGVGVQFPYFTIPETDESYLLKRNAEYVESLKSDGGKPFEARIKYLTPIWERISKEQIADLEIRLKSADERIRVAKEAEEKETDAVKKKPLEDARKEAEKSREAIAKQLEGLKGDAEFKTLQAEWKNRDAYLVDAFRLIANENLCLACHQVGQYEAKQRQGPALSQVYNRLRPDYLEVWLANPQRFLTYPSPMPQNFPADKLQYQAEFHGKSFQQLLGTRDALMVYPKVIQMPANRNRPVTVTGGK